MGCMLGCIKMKKEAEYMALCFLTGDPGDRPHPTAASMPTDMMN